MLYLSLIFLVVGLALGFCLGREFPGRRAIELAWRDGWRKSDGGVPPINAQAFEREKADHGV